MSKISSLTSLAVLSIALAACGGGSSGGGVQSIPSPPPAPTPPPPPPPSTPTDFSSWNSVPTTGILRLSGKSVEASYVPAQMNGTVGSYNTPGAGTVTADFTYSSGSQTGVSVQGTQSSVSFSNGDGSTKINLASSPSTTKYSSPSGATSLLVVDAAAAGYSYLSYGAWTGATSNTGYINSFHAGSPTPSGSVPTSGSATYRGTSTGYYSSVNGSVNAVTSDVALTTDFASRSISYVASNTQGSSAYPGLNITGTLTYSSGSSNFTGTLSTPQGFGTGVLSGTASGSFYGPSGQELGGAFVLNWVGGTVGQYVGSFGGKRQ